MTEQVQGVSYYADDAEIIEMSKEKRCSEHPASKWLKLYNQGGHDATWCCIACVANLNLDLSGT